MKHWWQYVELAQDKQLEIAKEHALQVKLFDEVAVSGNVLMSDEQSFKQLSWEVDRYRKVEEELHN